MTTFTYDGETINVQPMPVGPTWNNGGFPLTCGHRHVAADALPDSVPADTVWQSLDRYDRILACARCVKRCATPPEVTS